jgi:glycosyltransferase involved in cell wall biosynthesis
MRIAILSYYSGNINRGVETWTREIAGRLTRKGHDITVLQGREEKSKVDYIVKVIKVKILWKLKAGETWLYHALFSPYWFSINLEFTVRSLIPLMQFKPDIVIPSNGGVQTFLVRIYCWLFNWKMVVVGHAGIGAPDKWNLLFRPDVFVSPSGRGEIWAKSLFFANGIKIVHISHGIDLDKFSPDAKKVELELEKPIILCVSTFDPFKRVDLAIKAVSKLKKGSLLVIGGDTGQGAIDKMALENLGERRYLKVQVTPDEIPSYYASSDVFTLPSTIHEAFGIVYLEALSSNLPIVATNDELRREIVGDAGILIDPEKIDEYAKALEKAIGTDWGNKPRKQAQKYSWEEVTNKYENLFENLIKE